MGIIKRIHKAWSDKDIRDIQGNKSKINSDIVPIKYPSSSLLYTEHSRLIQPAWNLKGVEITKSEYLYYNPQIKTNIPFTHNVSSRHLEKDLYKPIYINQFQGLYS